MKNNGLKNEKAITLIAMVVTIIVLLILAGVSIAVLTGENGILNRATNAKQTNEQKTAEEELKLGVSALSIDYRKNSTNPQTFKEFVTSNSGANLKTAMGLEITNTDLIIENAANGVVSYKGQKYQVNDFGGVTEYVPMWVQNGTTVTKDGVTLNVGSEVSGYTATVNSTEIGNGKWFVLGAEDGKLLITTNKSYETVELSGIEDYLGGGVTKLNNAAAKYLDNGGLGSSARTIKYEDINRVTGFNPATDGSNVGQVYEYGNEVTYRKKDDGYIYYRGSNRHPEEDTKSTYTKFEYWNGTQLVELGTNESTMLTCTYARYRYNGNSLDSAIKGLFFTNSGNYPSDAGNYCLGSPSVSCESGEVRYIMPIVHNYGVEYLALFGSSGCTFGAPVGLRPVVTLASDVQVSSTGEITK